MKKGSSPTKRLIEMKGSKWAHDKKSHVISEKAEYSLTYTTSPKKSYVVEPKEGKIDYSKANNKHFIDTVKKQPITKHKL